jgi:predicted ABC-type ATPase
MANAIIIAGCNGAGKTSFARDLYNDVYSKAVFLNADEIQREGPAFSQPAAAGREFLRRLDELVSRKRSFALETTLSSFFYVQRIKTWKAMGYRVSLHFIEIESADLAVRRVAERVAHGGHGIPEADIRRRFVRGVSMFQNTYKGLCDSWYHYYMDEAGLRIVDAKE